MRVTTLGIILIAGAGWPALCQSQEPAFEAADVHASAKKPSQYVRTPPVRDGRYEIKDATMVDLIHAAYGFDTNKIVDGPNWVELDRFDVAAKVPPDSTPETRKEMLQTLLKERFALAVHKDTKPLLSHALVAGKKPQLKEATGSEEPGCRPLARSSSGPGGGQLHTIGPDGAERVIALGPGMTVEYNCRSVTMAEFAANLRSMAGANLGQTEIVDETGLKGKWNFDLHYTLAFVGPAMQNMDRVSVAEAVDKQLGLKLEERQIPTPVLVVDSANRTPSTNPPGTAEALPPIPIPDAFEVASVKPTDPDRRGGRFQIQPGGRLVVEGMPLQFLLGRAFNTFNSEELVNVPSFAQMARFDIVAKIPSGAPAVNMQDTETVAPMLLNLLKERFKLAYHTEERPMTAYSLVAAKPKMKKADPASRIYCRVNPAPPPAQPGTLFMACQNETMAQLAERLTNLAPGLNWPVEDATGIEGSWDFSLTFSNRPQMMMMARPGPGRGEVAGGGGGGGAPAPDVVPEAADPAGALTIFEALEKQVGLKLEKQKRPMRVFVIDHMEQNPTEN